jgi:cell pole-organizing protein PopZ
MYRAPMQTAGREPSMEDILASIKKVIAEEKELRTTVRAADAQDDEGLPEEQSEFGDDVLELDQPLAPAVDLGPPLVDEQAAGKSRQALEQLQTVAATVPPPQPSGNPLEEIIREMLRPMLKQWLDDHLPQMVDEHVKREISRITGRPL